MCCAIVTPTPPSDLVRSFPCSLFQQAKERVLVRLQERRQRARHDPRRAFSRLQVRCSWRFAWCCLLGQLRKQLLPP